jgi:hypothetical protein
MKTIMVEAITEITANNSLLNRKVFMYSPNLPEALKNHPQVRGLFGSRGLELYYTEWAGNQFSRQEQLARPPLFQTRAALWFKPHELSRYSST